MRANARHATTVLCGLLLCLCPGVDAALPAPTPAQGTPCQRQSTEAGVGGPTSRLAWRARLLGRTEVFHGIPGAGGERFGEVEPREAPWLLVLRVTRHEGRCWVKVRLPTRPNDATGWIDAGRLRLQATPWRLVVSRASRTLAVHRAGSVVRRMRIVIGTPATPTPSGTFAVVGAWRSRPDAFVGSWIFGLTAHSIALRRFAGGDGRVAVHGRGGASLLDPLGSAASHGCIRLANRAIGWIARSIGPDRLPGIPVLVR